MLQKSLKIVKFKFNALTWPFFSDEINLLFNFNYLKALQMI